MRLKKLRPHISCTGVGLTLLGRLHPPSWEKKNSFISFVYMNHLRDQLRHEYMHVLNVDEGTHSVLARRKELARSPKQGHERGNLLSQHEKSLATNSLTHPSSK